jgi:DMSO reductase anchor subunit
MAWKALRNLRHSWLSREVLFLSAYAGVAAGAVVAPPLAVAAMALGAAGVYSSARLYIVPGRPAWDTPLTVVRFFATAAAVGPALTGHLRLAATGASVALAATALNWVRLARHPSHPWWGAVRLELRWLRRWTLVRFAAGAAGIAVALAGWPAPAFVLLAGSELAGRWLFFVAVVPLNMPGAFWRGTAVNQ